MLQEPDAAPVIQEVRARSEQQKHASHPPAAVSLEGAVIQRKRKISALNKKQEAMFDSVQSLLSSKESEWEFIGKSLGLQLSQLNNDQQTIAQKLISDVIFYGKREKLTEMSSITVSSTSSTHNFQSPILPLPNTYDYHRFKRSTYHTYPSHNITSPSPPAESPSTSFSFHSESNTSVQDDYTLLDLEPNTSPKVFKNVGKIFFLQ